MWVSCVPSGVSGGRVGPCSVHCAAMAVTRSLPFLPAVATTLLWPRSLRAVGRGQSRPFSPGSQCGRATSGARGGREGAERRACASHPRAAPGPPHPPQAHPRRRAGGLGPLLRPLHWRHLGVQVQQAGVGGGPGGPSHTHHPGPSPGDCPGGLCRHCFPWLSQDCVTCWKFPSVPCTDSFFEFLCLFCFLSFAMGTLQLSAVPDVRVDLGLGH